jgi:hypothetical protein
LKPRLSINIHEILSFEISQLTSKELGIEYLVGVPILFEKQFRDSLCLVGDTINPGDDI